MTEKTNEALRARMTEFVKAYERTADFGTVRASLSADDMYAGAKAFLGTELRFDPLVGLGLQAPGEAAAKDALSKCGDRVFDGVSGEYVCGLPKGHAGEHYGVRTQAPLNLDTDTHVFFYEQDHYYLSNFSAFKVSWRGLDMDTAEAAYHAERFERDDGMALHHQVFIRLANSAHEAFRYAQEHKADQRSNWDDEKVGVMKMILTAKAQQHEYVRRKLLQTGDKILVENSWRDPFWGWGPNRDGKNMLGKLWMVVRAELSAREKP